MSRRQKQVKGSRRTTGNASSDGTRAHFLQGDSPTGFGKWDLLILFAAALVVRLLYLFSIRGEVFFAVPQVDSKVFWEQALALTSGAGLPDAYYKPPLLTWLLAGWIKLLGEDFGSVRACLVVISACAAPLTALLAGPLLGRKGALLAGALVAVYAPAVFYGLEVLPASLVLVLNLIFLLLLVRAEERRNGLLFSAAGLVLGLSALAHPTSLLLAPLLLIRHRKHPRWAGLLLAGVLVVVLPVTVRNASRDSLVAISSNGGINFYMGNHAGSDGKSASAPELPGVATEAHLASIAHAEEQVGRELTSAEVSRFWFGKGLAWIRDDPSAALSLGARKLYYLLNNREVADNIDFYAVTEISLPLRLLPLRFGLLFAVALPGALILWRSSRGRLLLLYGLAVALPMVVFFYVGRFRLPLLPVLSIAAAAGILELGHRLRKAPVRAGMPALLMVLGLLLSHSKLFGVAEDTSWHFYRNRGDILYGKGQLAAACQAYEESIRRNNRNAGTRNALAFVYAEQGVHLDRAERHIRIALDLAPQRKRFFLDSLGWVLFKQGDLAAAAVALEEAIPLFAEHEAYSRAEARYHLGLVRQAQGAPVAAERLFRAALPDYPQAEAELMVSPPAADN